MCCSGHIGNAPFYIGASQFEVWRHTDLIIDVVPGRGGMFSLDNGREKRFLTRSTICAARAECKPSHRTEAGAQTATECLALPASKYLSNFAATLLTKGRLSTGTTKWSPSSTSIRAGSRRAVELALQSSL